MNPVPSVPSVLGGHGGEDDQEDEDEVPAGVADEAVERQVQVDPAPPRVRGEPVVAAVKVPAGGTIQLIFL